jgi:hypothetical protein
VAVEVDGKAALFRNLEARGIAWALVGAFARGPSGENGAASQRPTQSAGEEIRVLTILVAEADRPALREIARAAGLRRADRRGDDPVTHVGEGTWVTVTSRLRYGRRGWLGAQEHVERILRRAREERGVRVLHPADALVHTLLLCILDLGRFPEEDWRRVTGLMARLRADPPAAGRAAERVQQELAPALTWGELLADVVESRPDALLARRRRLCWRLLAGAPVESSLRALSLPRGRSAGRFSAR